MVVLLSMMNTHFKVLSQHLLAVSQKNHEKLQDNRLLGQESNRVHTEYETKVLITQLKTLGIQFVDGGGGGVKLMCIIRKQSGEM
jgi:hypothetical protein